VGKKRGLTSILHIVYSVLIVRQKKERKMNSEDREKEKRRIGFDGKPRKD